jgi:triacylglycerol lipase
MMLDWIAQHASEFGADQDRIVIVGQSAGAAHVAGYLFNQGTKPASKAICGAVLMSGFYHANSAMGPGPTAYFGNDESVWDDRSPATHARTPHTPILLSVAEFDPAAIAGQTLDLACVLNEIDGCPPQLIWFEGHNHVSTVHSLGLGKDEVGHTLLGFVRRVTSREAMAGTGAQEV